MPWMKLAPYILAAAAAAGVYGTWVWRGYEIDRLTMENRQLQGSLNTCNARARELIRDTERDDAIDRLNPDELRDVPDRWMRDDAAGPR